MLNYKKTLKKINLIKRNIVKLDDEALKAKTTEFKQRLVNGETLEQILPEAFAVVREASRRVLGLEHFDVQIHGGMVLHDGNIAEMKTGEGKTLVAALPSYLNALTGKGVHVVTVNDYLAQRDAEEIGQIHEFLGLSVGCVLAEMERDVRREMYAKDITYVTNSELGFDYLRDNMVLTPDERVQRNLEYCIIDEIDSILIDEARTPLIISGKGETPTDLYLKADMIAKQLRKGKRTEADKWSDAAAMETGDYIVDTKEKTVYLTSAGVKIVERLFGIRNLMDETNATLNHLIQMALRANTLFQKDKDYIVDEDEVLIVDPFTGRTLAGRRFSDGLHQAIEAKEGCTIKTETLSMATITYQHFFNKYNKKCGMTGTAMTEKTEFKQIYGLKVEEIPTNRPIARIDDQDLVYLSKDEKYHEICKKIKQIHETGQPILVGTASIDVSELISASLQTMQITHNVLNAKHHAREAEIISLAGQKGAVTIATNMAGRGTDIKLDDDARKAGGLYVIGTERHESRRIDNQLRGRSGRQGDPGHSVFMISLEDDIMKDYGSQNYIEALKKAGVEKYEAISSKMLVKQITNAQQRVEGNNFSQRKMLLDFDSVNDEQRELIYAERNRIVDGEDPKDMVIRMAMRTLNALQEECKEDPELFNTKLFSMIHLQIADSFKTNQDKMQFLEEILPAVYDNYSKSLPSPDIMPMFVRSLILKTMDKKWIHHIDALEHLRQGIGLRSYGQHDPKIEYKLAAYDMFDEMLLAVSKDIFMALFRPVLPYRRA